MIVTPTRVLLCAYESARPGCWQMMLKHIKNIVTKMIDKMYENNFVLYKIIVKVFIFYFSRI